MIAVALNGVAGVVQPPLTAGPGEGILTTFSANGGDPYDRRLEVFEDDGALWLFADWKLVRLDPNEAVRARG